MKEMLEGGADKNGMSNYIFDPSLFNSLRRRCFCNLKPLFSTQDISIVMTLSILRPRIGLSVNMTPIFYIIRRTVTNRTLLSGHAFESKPLVVLVDWFLVANRRTTCFEFMHIHLEICSNLWKTYGELFRIKWSPRVDSCCGFGTLKNSPLLLPA